MRIERPKTDAPLADTSQKIEHDLNSDNNLVEKRRPLTPAAKRALAEAKERRRLAQTTQKSENIKELGGRAGPDPVRYGDWENSGIASDF
ncbi:MAG: hypothetical protein TECD_00005 [Hyphomicrobiaceae bacterium hypho_1]